MARRTKKSDAAPADARETKPDDVALVWGASADGDTLAVLRKRGEQVTPTLMQRAREGQPIHGELVRLQAREEPLLFDVDVLYEGQADASEGRDGPARVASDAYRKGWDRLFKRPRRAAAN